MVPSMTTPISNSSFQSVNLPISTQTTPLRPRTLDLRIAALTTSLAALKSISPLSRQGPYRILTVHNRIIVASS